MALRDNSDFFHNPLQTATPSAIQRLSDSDITAARREGKGKIYAGEGRNPEAAGQPGYFTLARAERRHQP
jgi:hypothetical protein